MPYALAHRKEKNAAIQVKRRAEKKQILSQYCCIACDNSNPDLVDWHHVNPDEKEFGVMSNMLTSTDKWWNEVLKCVPLCPNCHRLIHMNLLCLIPMKT